MMTLKQKLWLKVTAAALAPVILLFGVLFLSINRQVILGDEWDGDGPAQFAFFGRFILPVIIISIICFLYALLKSIGNLNVLARPSGRQLLLAIAFIPVLALWTIAVQPRWLNDFAQHLVLDATKIAKNPLDSGPTNP